VILYNLGAAGGMMAGFSKIEWTGATWNPVTGCTKVSDGCKNCYAERIAYRLQAQGQPHYVDGFEVRIHEDSLGIPLKWKKPRIVFVNSMSDLFHEEIPMEFLKRVFLVMNHAKQHVFQILTKRSEYLLKMNRELVWSENIWMGVSVENQKYLGRIEHLRNTHAHIKFISIEPLLGPMVDMNLSGIDWVILGGESGPRSRMMKRSWVENIRDQCVEAKVPFFFKQWGGFDRKKSGRVLDGKVWEEMPKIQSVALLNF
jgi:protein gp37